MTIRWRALARDVGIVLLFPFLGGIVVGAAGPEPERMMPAIAISNVIFGIVAFTIAGCLTPRDRFTHLSLVASLAWLISVINVLFFAVAFTAWLASIVAVFVTMAIGGGISLLIVKPQT